MHADLLCKLGRSADIIDLYFLGGNLERPL